MARATPAVPGKVRIIAGTWRGRRLPVADVPGLRPTPDRVRETLFNWLAPVIEGSRCLDLFAGTGALGLEAASRGAAHVSLVERDPRALAVLRANVGLLAAGDTVQVVAADALPWLRSPPSAPFDLVFLDPPYDAGLLAPALAALLAGGWLAPTAWLYLEWPRGAAAPLAATPWRSLTAGQVQCALYRAADARPAPAQP